MSTVMFCPTKRLTLGEKSFGEKVSVVYQTGLKVASTVKCGFDAQSVIALGEGRLAYVTNSLSNSVPGFDIKVQKIVSVLTLGIGPNGISVRP